MKRGICLVQKFAIVFFCAEDCDIHSAISAIGIAITTKASLAAIDNKRSFFLFARACRFVPQDEHFLNRRGRLDEKQGKEQEGSFDSQRESSRENDDLRAAVAWQRALRHRIDVRVTWERGDARRFVSEAAKLDLLIAAGGDGTLNEVVHGLMDLSKAERPTFGNCAARHRQ
jgi:predicted polyphosphate/ATP-dependent NAD kinase